MGAGLLRDVHGAMYFQPAHRTRSMAAPQPAKAREIASHCLAREADKIVLTSLPATHPNAPLLSRRG
jgi:hypothetical protein